MHSIIDYVLVIFTGQVHKAIFFLLRKEKPIGPSGMGQEFILRVVRGSLLFTKSTIKRSLSGINFLNFNHKRDVQFYAHYSNITQTNFLLTTLFKFFT